MPNPPDYKRADGLSKDTEFSGLPKACRMRLTGNTQACTLNIWNNLFMESLQYNYGGYVVQGAGAPYLYGVVVIPEPGIYRFQGGFIANTLGDAIVGINYNAAGAGSVQFGHTSHASIGNGVRANYSGIDELKTNDTIQLNLFPTTNMIVANSWFHVEKVGGQY